MLIPKDIVLKCFAHFQLDNSEYKEPRFSIKHPGSMVEITSSESGTFCYQTVPNAEKCYLCCFIKQHEYDWMMKETFNADLGHLLGE